MLRPGAAFASTKMRSHGRHSPRTGSLRALRAHLRPVRGCTLVARGKPRREPSRRLRQRLHLHARATQPRAGAGAPRLPMQSQEVEQSNSPTPADQPTRGQGNLRPRRRLTRSSDPGLPREQVPRHVRTPKRLSRRFVLNLHHPGGRVSCRSPAPEARHRGQKPHSGSHDGALLPMRVWLAWHACLRSVTT